MLVDVLKALFAIVIFTAMWWLLTPYISTLWDALHPIIAQQAATGNSVAQAGISTLSILQALWNFLPVLVDGAIIVWVYLRAQRREPDTYYVE